MPEFPEIFVISRQMNERISGLKVENLQAPVEKAVYPNSETLKKEVIGRRIEQVFSQGKWVIISLAEDGYLGINLNLGGEIIYYNQWFPPPSNIALKRKLDVSFSDNSGFYVTFAWLGYLRYAHCLGEDKVFGSLGISCQKLTEEHFFQVLSQKKGRIKTFLLDQKNIAGIGNFYVHDILFLAKIHPLRTIPSLSATEKKNLYSALKEVMNKALQKGGSWYEVDFYGKKGHFTEKDLLIPYFVNNCPSCQSKVEKIKTGTTSSYICPNCQKL